MEEREVVSLSLSLRRELCLCSARQSIKGVAKRSLHTQQIKIVEARMELSDSRIDSTLLATFRGEVR